MRLKKGSYLLEELDGTRMKRVYAARRVRRYYPRGRREEDIFAEELSDENEEDEEVWDGIDGIPVEDAVEGEKVMGPIIGYADTPEEEPMDIDRPTGDLKPDILIELPEEELRSLDDKEILFEERERDMESDTEESIEEEEPEKRRRQVPDRYMHEGWNLHTKKSSLKMTPLPADKSEGSGDEGSLEGTNASKSKENRLPTGSNKKSAKALGKQKEEPIGKTRSGVGPRKFWVEINPRKELPAKLNA